MRALSRLTPLLLLVALVVGATGCDTIAEKLGVDKVNMPLSSAGALAVNGDTPAYKAQSVTRDGGSLPNVFDVKSVTITPADLTWTTSSKSAMASGTVYINVMVKRSGVWLPFVDGSVTITNDVVTAVTPRLYEIGTQAKAAYDKLPAGSKPDLSGANGKTPAEIASLVETALRDQNIEASILVTGTPGLRGSITVNKIQINLDF